VYVPRGQVESQVLEGLAKLLEAFVSPAEAKQLLRAWAYRITLDPTWIEVEITYRVQS